MAKPIEAFSTGPSLPEEWFDGQAWLLVEGEDYPSEGLQSVARIRNQLQNQAKRMGLFLKTRLVTGGLAIQASTTPVRAGRKVTSARTVAEPVQGPSYPHGEDMQLIDDGSPF